MSFIDTFFKSSDKQEKEITNEKYDVRDVMIGHDTRPFVIVVYHDGDCIEIVSSAPSAHNYISIYRTQDKPTIVHRRDKYSPGFDRHYYDLFVPDDFKFGGANTTVNDIDAFGTLEKRQVNVM
jgi:hypothetical protein